MELDKDNQDKDNMTKANELQLWMGYSYRDFIMAFATEVMQETKIIHGYTKILHEDPSLKDVMLSQTGSKAGVEHFTETILERTDRIMKLLDITSEYLRTNNQNKA
jgi:hypothetical protein